ncbi:SEC-C domain-containing protein [Texcoconibacillus texcoconensis]|uniref:HTH psq-type domain-containing protein n=1 Tax=Texcoconibacillus texcoconensis TaxID=1095777 RepID=A0A840QLV0_9BACI|nr:SEC-C domain-containing protein [Texcoconibacillus texcoconensis]MBB5172352.1 hypothetical protein [Texcoconibacillus texcoconensis]
MSVGRNELCPCGSQKKYKKCCLSGEMVSIEKLVRQELKKFIYRMNESVSDLLMKDYNELSAFERKLRKSEEYPLSSEEKIHLYNLWYAIFEYPSFLENYIRDAQNHSKRVRTIDALEKMSTEQTVVFGTVVEYGRDSFSIQRWLTGERVTLYSLNDQLPSVHKGDTLFTLALGYKDGYLALPRPIVTPFLHRPEARIGKMYQNSGHKSVETFYEQELFDILGVLIDDERFDDERDEVSESNEKEAMSVQNAVNQYDWATDTYAESANMLASFIESFSKKDQEKLAVMIDLLHKYYEQRAPRVRKAAVYSAAMVEWFKSVCKDGLLNETQQKLAKHFSVSPNSISRVAHDMNEVLDPKWQNPVDDELDSVSKTRAL